MSEDINAMISAELGADDSASIEEAEEAAQAAAEEAETEEEGSQEAQDEDQSPEEQAEPDAAGSDVPDTVQFARMKEVIGAAEGLMEMYEKALTPEGFADAMSELNEAYKARNGTDMPGFAPTGGEGTAKTVAESTLERPKLGADESGNAIEDPGDKALLDYVEARIQEALSKTGLPTEQAQALNALVERQAADKAEAAFQARLKAETPKVLKGFQLNHPHVKITDKEVEKAMRDKPGLTGMEAAVLFKQNEIVKAAQKTASKNAREGLEAPVTSETRGKPLIDPNKDAQGFIEQELAGMAGRS